MSFIPKDYDAPKPDSGYLKLEDGDTRVRLLASPVMGYKYLDTSGKWHNFKEEPKVDKSEIQIDKYGNQYVQHFWLIPVWDYESKSIKVWEITQVTIQGQLVALARDEDWGSPLEYDIKINRVEENVVKYTITPVPKKELTEEITKAFKEKTFDFEKRFDSSPPAAAAEEPQEEKPKEEVEIGDLPFSPTEKS